MDRRESQSDTIFNACVLAPNAGFFGTFRKKNQGQKNSSQKKTQANFQKTQAKMPKTSKSGN